MTTHHVSRRHIVARAMAATAVALLLVMGIAAAPAASHGSEIGAEIPEPETMRTDPWVEYAPGTVIVKVKAGVDLHTGPAQVRAEAATLSTLLDSLGATAASPVFGDAVAASRSSASKASRAGLDRIYRLDYARTIPVDHAVALLAADPNVEYAEPDYVARPARIPDDPQYAEQWALPKINAPAAWDESVGSDGVIIALIDSGIDLNHEDLAGRLWVNTDEQAGTGQDDDENGYVDDVHGWNVVGNNANLADDNGHGTQVAGVAGAATDNGVGIAGVCWNCELMVVKAMQASGVANYSDVATAVAYAASNGADVINLSLGGYADSGMLHDAIREAAVTATIIGGAGNDDGAEPFYPAAYPEVIGVAATDQSDEKAIFSNHGAWVDVAAPGMDIRATTVGGYATADGTSLSTPMVAGLAGLIKSANPTWTSELVGWHILNTATDIDGINPSLVGQLGRGRIDAGTALTTAPQPKAEVSAYAIDGVSNARPAPGESFELVVTVFNQWMPARNLQGTLSSADPYVTITDANGAFGSIEPGKTDANSDDPFGVTLGGTAPYNHSLDFTLNLSGDGGYSLSVPFAVKVRSAVETLGNTIYTEDTTWTNDKTYVLDGTVIVGEGITLTVQPGTLIKGNPDKFVRVDGTLIAQGTTEEPIIFTTNSVTTTAWSGLRFTGTAVDAHFSGGGDYQGGSILQHVEISHAEIGVKLGDRAPFIADSVFHRNGTSIHMDTGSPRVERNRFTGHGSVDEVYESGGTAIYVNGGRPSVRENTFIGIGSGISGEGSPQILDNTFRDNSGMAISLSWGSGAPILHDNVIVNNGGAVNLGGLRSVDIKRNLIAGNTGADAALSLAVQSTSGLHYPTLAYNSAENEYLVSWSNLGMDEASDVVRFQRIAADGEPLTSVTSWGCSEAAALVHNLDRNEYLISTLEGEAIDARVCAERIGADGALLGSTAVITDRAAHHGKSIYQTDDQRYLLLWQSGDWPSTMYAQWLTPDDGMPLGDPIGFGDDVPYSEGQQLGGAAYDPLNNRTLAVFRGNNDYNRLWGAWLSGPEIAPSASFTLTQDPEGRSLYNPSVGYGEDRFLTVWERDLGWDTGRPVMGQIVAADGTVLVDQQIIHSGTVARQPQVAFGGTQSEFMVVWVQNPTPGTGNTREVIARRVGLDGSPVGDPIVLRPELGTTDYAVGAPTIGYNSQQDEFLVAWAEQRHGNGAIYGQRISASGELLDNAWTPEDESQPSINFRLAKPRGVQHNTIIHNNGNGMRLRGDGLPNLTIIDNNLFGNGAYEIYLEDGSPGTQNYTISAIENYWNLPTSEIPGRIRDCTFDDNACGTASSTLAKVDYLPVLPEPDQTAPGFVQSATMGSDVIGLETSTLTLDFSRPMITGTVPTATFYDARRGTTEQMLDQRISGYPQGMAEDVIGRLWVAGDWDNPGVHMYDGRQWTHYRADNSGLGSDDVQVVYGASNGDVWFGHGNVWEEGNAWLSRLQGTTWITYSNEAPSVGWGKEVQAIGEEASGALWFADLDSLFRFDGATWQHHSVEAQQIACDGRGRMWFRTWQGLSVYDGESWETHDEDNGLPTHEIRALFADSQGRIWVGFGWQEDNNPAYVGMHDGGAWTFYGRHESEGRLSSDVSAFAEAPDGAIWMWAGSQIVTFDGESWGNISGDFGYGSSQLAVDTWGNLWHTKNETVYVRWGGLDYGFTNGEWLSATRFQASYTFNATVPRGSYQVYVDGAVGSDGMTAYGGSTNTFEVDYGGAASTLPPLPPRVEAQTDGTLSNISASWQAKDSDVDFYRYAIGTSPGARDVVGWTYLAATGMTRDDLHLQDGATYYVTVQARNTSGLWSADSVSNPVVGGVATASAFEVYLPLVVRSSN